jgi:hypothetical protein
MKGLLKKPLKAGRYWWKEPESQSSEVVFIEQQTLGLYVVGKGWLPWQEAEWNGPLGEDEQSFQE